MHLSTVSLGLGGNHIPHGPVSAPALFPHPGKLWVVVLDVVIDTHILLVVMFPVQAQRRMKIAHFHINCYTTSYATCGGSLMPPTKNRLRVCRPVSLYSLWGKMPSIQKGD